MEAWTAQNVLPEQFWDPGARLIIHERIMTEGEEQASTDFEVEMQGEDSGVDLISRSVARDHSYQGNTILKSAATAAAPAILNAMLYLIGDGKVNAAPELFAPVILMLL